MGGVSTGRVRKARATATPEDVLALLDALPMPAMLVSARDEVVHANAAMRACEGYDAGHRESLPVSLASLGPCTLVIGDPPGPGAGSANAQTQRLASLGFMLAGVCQEVSNPLAAIHSMVQILQSRRGVTPETIEKGLGSIAGNIVRVLAITRKLGDFSRVTGDAPQPQALDAAVREALGLLRHSRWGEDVEVAYAGLSEAIIRARPGELQQVIFNVMLNAAQAMHGRGRIEVSTERESAGRICVRVRDTGPGIPEENLRRIFEPFFTTKAPGDGTGLGLAICFEIVHELGGTLTASNHPGGGACMELVLPGAA